MSDPTLLPCPRCDGPAELKDVSDARQSWWQPRCTRCECILNNGWASKDEAAEEWNTRDAEIKRLQDIVKKLPKTMDGVPLTDGMPVFAKSGAAGRVMVAYRTVDLSERPFFSSREAAEAATTAKPSE